MARSGRISGAEIRGKISLEGARIATQAANDFGRALSSLIGTAGRASGAFTGVAESVAGLAAQFGPVGAALGSTIRGLSEIANVNVALSTAIVQTGIDLEGIRLRLQFASGSAEEGTRNFNFFIDTVNRVGLSLEETAPTFAKFQAAVRSSGRLSLEQGRNISEAFLEASAVLRLTGAETAGVFLALEQMVSRGFVSMEELRRQLGNRLPGAFELAAQAMGTTTIELQKLISTGQLATAELLPRLAAVLKTAVAGQLEEAGESAFAAFNKLRNALFLLRTEAATKFLPVIADVVEQLVAFAKSDEAVELAREYGEALSQAAVILSELIKDLPRLLRLFEQFASIVTTVNAKIEGLVARLESVRRLGVRLGLIDELREVDQELVKFKDRVEAALDIDISFADKFVKGAGDIKRLSEVAFSELRAQLDKTGQAFGMVSARLEELRKEGKIGSEEFLFLGSIVAELGRRANILQEATQLALQRGILPLATGAGELSKELEKAGKEAVRFAEGFAPPISRLDELRAAQNRVLADFKAGLLTFKQFTAAMTGISFEILMLTTNFSKLKTELDRGSQRFKSVQDALQSLFPERAEIARLEEIENTFNELSRLPTKDLLKEFGLTPQDIEDVRKKVAELRAELELGDLADDVGELVEAQDRMKVTLDDLANSFSLIGDNAARIFQAIGQERWAEVARAIGGVIDAVTALIAAFGTLARVQAGGGGGGQGQEGGTQAVAQALAVLGVFNAWLAAIAAAFAVFEAFARKSRDFVNSFTVTIEGLKQLSEEAATIGFAAGGPISRTITGGAIDFSGITAELIRFMESFNEAFRNILNITGIQLPAALDEFQFQLKTKVSKKTGQVEEVFVRIADETGRIISSHFETIAQAEQFILQEFLRQAVESGAIVDEAIKQVIQGFEGDPERFSEAVARVQELTDQALMALDGFTAIELTLQKLPAQLQALEIELLQLGLSADQVTRLVGGQLVASLQAARQAITGEELSIEQQKANQKAKAELFNATLALERAELEAKKAALAADIGLTNAEILLLRGSVEGFKNALRAKGIIYSAEIELIIRQIQAIDKILAALPKEIDIGNLKLPGLPKINDNLGKFNRRIRDSGNAANEAARKIEQLRDAIESLRQFRVGLLTQGIQTPLPIQRQLDIARREFERQRRIAARTGEVADFQQAAQTLLELARSAFASGAGFNKIFRDVIKASEGLEDELGSKLDELLKSAADKTAENTRRTAENTARTANNTERGVQKVEDLRKSTMDGDERNQVGHGKTHVGLDKVGGKIDTLREELGRELRLAIERIKVA